MVIDGSGSQYPRALLATILFVLNQRENGSSDDTKAYYVRLVPALVTKTLLPLVDGAADVTSEVLSADEVLEVTGTLIRVILRELDADQQKEALQGMFDLFVSYKPSTLVTEGAEDFAQKFHPLEKDSDVRQANTSIILACAVAGARKEVPLPVENVVDFLNQTIEQAKRPKSPNHRRALLNIIGVIVNKWMGVAEADHIKQLTDDLLEDIKADSPDPEADEKLRIVFWILKALLLRTDKYGMDAIQVLVDLLGSERMGAMASRGFGILLSEDEFLSKKNHAVMRLLAKQRAFSLCVPRLVEGFRGASAGMYLEYFCLR